jgi:hypothetical protein
MGEQGQGDSRRKEREGQALSLKSMIAAISDSY